ncbi:MAG: hypothetical protein AB1345_10880 [Chloroflexota bacterium]
MLWKYRIVWLVVVAAMLFSASCGGAVDSSEKVVKAYLQALTAKDAARVSELVCADWQAVAVQELEILQEVETRLEDLACQQSGVEGEMALVTCRGNIIVTSDNEEYELDLSLRVYKVVQTNGEYRVCGYQ